MSDKNKELLFFCLLALESIFGAFDNPIFFVLQCVSGAGVLILSILMIVKDVKAKKAAKQAKENSDEQ